ncbi:MAG TPA: hypothetical protein VM900_09065 [Sphingomonas sp.]|jgi:hypothetical protein|nr:hypothetical protein [Sphingomonas sp.]
MANKTYDEASSVGAEEGNVYVDGPDGVAVAMTPGAAAETSDRLLHAANMAQGQRIAERQQEEENRARHPH